MKARQRVALKTAPSISTAEATGPICIVSAAITADEIVVLGARRIAERGSHAALPPKDGRYAKMWARRREEREAVTAE